MNGDAARARITFRTLMRLGWRIALAPILLIGGCQRPNGDEAKMPPVSTGLTIAVAPALNFSGAADLDPVRVADLLASELSQAGGWTVVPVNRTVAVLARDGKWQVESPAHALRVAAQLGVDGVCVPGITEYDPYTPMVVGMVCQLYVLDLQQTSGGWSGAAAPITASSESLRPRLAAQTVFNAAQDRVVERLKKFAVARDADKSPFAWRRYMVSQELFLRFCCGEMAQRLLEQERERTPVSSASDAP